MRLLTRDTEEERKKERKKEKKKERLTYTRTNTHTHTHTHIHRERVEHHLNSKAYFNLTSLTYKTREVVLIIINNEK